MRRFLAVALSLAAVWGCKDPQRVEAEKQVMQSREHVELGRKALNDGKPSVAADHFKQAISQVPRDVKLYVLLAEAYRQAGNETGAVLTLKQAEQVMGRADPSLQRARADLYKAMHQPQAAIKELQTMLEGDLLTTSEILDLARLQASQKDVDGAFKTLARIQAIDPDNLEAKTVEAEILLIKGDELLAAKLMDRLLEEHPELTTARLLRARYFRSNGMSEFADKDLAMVPAADATREDVVALRAKVLMDLERAEEAALILEPLVVAQPDDVELGALLAEIRLQQGHAEEAQKLVDKVLAKSPRLPRALYVRGRAREAQGYGDSALDDYELARKENPGFAPALSRLWRFYEKKDNKAEAMATLETLLYLNEISDEEKLKLAGFYADTGSNVTRGKKLVDEALARDPKNKDYLALKKRLARLSGSVKKSGGIIIMKGR